MSTSPSRPALQTHSLEQAQAFTSRVWGRHHSTVPATDEFASDISRIPLGGSHFCTVDCASPIEVVLTGCSLRAFLYLPLEGCMEIRVNGEIFHAVPGGPVLIPAKTAYEFRATPIHCIVLELRAERLLNELAASGVTGKLPPLAWPADDAGARSLSALIEFAKIELATQRRLPPPPAHLRRIESLLISCLAQMLTERLGSPLATDHRIGRRSPAEIEAWLQSHLLDELDLAALAAFAGLSLRSLQRRFLQHFHSSPSMHLRDLRLAAAHAELSRPNGRMSVTEVAMTLHFEHLGRFSAAYRRMFGESPSETLGRSKHRAP